MPNTAKRKTAAKGRQTTKNRREAENSPAIRKEIKLIGLAGLGILLLIAVFTPGILGIAGTFFRSLLIGLLGLGGVLLPIAVIAFDEPFTATFPNFGFPEVLT